MIKRFKRWFYGRFLPAVAKEQVWEENKKLKETIRELQNEIARQKAYSAGLEFGMRSIRKINIRLGDDKK